MDKKIYDAYVEILKEELVPAMGCTEPIAVAYAAAKAREVLGTCPQYIKVLASPNIIKNVKSVIVPNTGALRGIDAAAVAGAVAGNADLELQVLSRVTEEEVKEIADALKKIPCEVKASDNGHVFYILAEMSAGTHTASVEITGHHTCITEIKKDGIVTFSSEYKEEGKKPLTDRTLLNVRDIVEFADIVNTDDVADVLSRQIEYNTAIAKEGLNGKWGANIGSILLKSYGMSVHNRAKAYAAAGSDARMSGSEMPVVINSGSGNQGLTASLPVIVYAEELNVSRDMLYRALTVSNLVTIHLKTGIGALSAYCGATSAGCGAGAGIAYLYGGKYHEISHTIVNALAIDSGMICDGAKPSCAAKIASAVEAGLLGLQMQQHDKEFFGGDGIIVKGVENTIKNVNSLAHDGMRETDKVIIGMMT